MVIWHLKQIGKMKKLNKWVSQELTANQINSLLEVSFSLTLCNNSMQRQCEFYVTTSDDQFSGWTENNFQSQTCTNKSVMVTASWFAASLIHYSFLNPSETLHLRSMLSKSMRCTTTPATSVGQQKGPSSFL